MNKFTKDEWLFYATKSIDEHLEISKQRFIKISKVILIVTGVFFLIGLVSSFVVEPLEKQLEREAYGGEIKKIDLNVAAMYEKEIFYQKVEVAVLPKTLTLAEEENRINKCIVLLSKEILGKNMRFTQITEDLNIVEYDKENGVDVAWESSMPQYVDAQGKVNFLAFDRKEHITMVATLKIGCSEKQHSFTMILDPFAKKDFSENIKRSVTLSVDNLNKESSGQSLRLPEKNEEGLIFSWTIAKRSAPFFLIPLCALLVVFLYFSQTDSVKKIAKQRKAAIEEELPNLALQLILLLNAGLVVHAAFQEILVQNKDSIHPLYEILEKLSFQCNQSNESLVKVFYSFSQRSGNRNLIRFMTLVSDHEIRGSELSQKLQREKDILWENRLQRAKGKAKQAETKLCLPLMMLLLVLVVISVAPALLEL